jgi:hypothetical protein
LARHRGAPLGVHVAELPPAPMAGDIAFTWRGTAAGAANGETYVVAAP